MTTNYGYCCERKLKWHCSDTVMAPSLFILPGARVVWGRLLDRSGHHGICEKQVIDRQEQDWKDVFLDDGWDEHESWEGWRLSAAGGHCANTFFKTIRQASPDRVVVEVS